MHVLVPAAGIIRGIDGTSSSQSPLLRITRGKAFFELLLEQMEQANLPIEEILLGALARDFPQLKFIASKFSISSKITFVSCDGSKSSGETISKLLTLVPYGRKVLLNLGDTVAFFDWTEVCKYDFGFACVPHNSSSRRLSTRKLDSQRFQLNSEIQEDAVDMIGIYWFVHSPEIEFSEVGKSLENGFLGVAGACRVVLATSWTDADFTDRFQKTSTAYFDSRAFNTVTRFGNNQLVRKTSPNKEKLRLEYKYLDGLPLEKAAYFPAIRGYQESNEAASIIMDYWPLDNLSDIYCFRDYPEFFWEDLMSALVKTLNTIHSPAEEDFGDYQYAFFEKTYSRLEAMRELEDFSNIVNNESVLINGKICLGPKQVLAEARECLSSENITRSEVHGDFCFSNILVDTSSLTLKLIDPRGGFREPGPKGPTRYDAAKLAHSLIGSYDLILKGFFSLNQLGNQFEISINTPPHHCDALKAFRTYFAAEDKELNRLSLESALILISIPPLHLEDMSRAKAFLVKGLLDATSAIQALKGQ